MMYQLIKNIHLYVYHDSLIVIFFQMERQLVMQNQMREKQMAMQMSGSRELLNWYGSFYAVAMLGMIAG